MLELSPTYTSLWILWILMFAAIEGPALIDRRKGDTLTEHFSVWLSIRHQGRAWRCRRLVALAFLIWLVVHELTGWV